MLATIKLVVPIQRLVCILVLFTLLVERTILLALLAA